MKENRVGGSCGTYGGVQKCNFFVTVSYIITITQFCIWNISRLLFRAVNSNQILIHSFHLNCFPWIFPFTLCFSFGFQLQLSLVCLFGSCFSILSFPRFSWSSFREGSHYFSGPFHKSSWCSFFIVVLGTWRSLSPDSKVWQWHRGIGIHLHQEYFHVGEKLSHEIPFQFCVW